MCNCEYCIKCDRCGHKADEHLAGEGQCFLCKCPNHISLILDEWSKLNITTQSAISFQEFADKMIGERDDR
jgi:hypothetical protein